MSAIHHPSAGRTGLPSAPRTTTVRPPRTTGRRAPEPPSTRSVRHHGFLLALGAGLWAAADLAIGVDEPSPTWGRVSEASGLAFLLGVAALLRTLWRTRATGTSRAAAALLVVEHVLLGVACLSTVATTVFFHSTHPVLVVLDASWPLSMLGMLVIAVEVAVTGRWKGVLRVLVLWAGSWFPLVVVVIVLLGRGAADVGSATAVLTGYGLLGVVLAARPHLTGARG